MSPNPPIKRRSFVRLCASTLASVSAAPTLLAQTNGSHNRHNRVRLVNADDQAILSDKLAVGENYIFHYPYICTPCFLLDLGKPTFDHTMLKTEDGRSYRWEGGVGPKRSIVAFSAICAHKMTHPAKSVSFINYRHNEVRFRDKDETYAQRSQVIYCCSEKSVYDPTQGARVIGGPAPQPLAAVELEYDEAEETLYATGTYGGDMFNQFFEQFADRLALEYETSNIEQQVTDTTTVMTLEEFTETMVTC